MRHLNDIKKAHGTFKIDIEYVDTRSQWDYHVIGEDVLVDDYAYKSVSLDGKIIDNAWIIDQLALDHISIAADILRKPGSWFINFLGIQLGKSILMGLQGEYFEESRMVDGKVNLLDVNIEALNEWPDAQFLLTKMAPKRSFESFRTFPL